MAGNSTVAAMTAASALGGTELFYVNQGGADRKATATQIQTFIGSGLTIGTTAITSGTTTRILYDNAGVVGEYTLSGSGTVVAMATSPVLTTPTLGVAIGTSLALGGATIGTDALGITGTTTLGGNVTIASASQLLWSTDLKLTRAAAASLQLGGADATTATAQTLQVQSVTGAANTAGANFSIVGSAPTGSGQSGNIMLATSARGASKAGVAVTCSSGAGAQITLAANRLVTGQPFQFTSGTAPTGTALNTTYYVAFILNQNSFTFSATPFGSNITTSSTGSGLQITTQSTPTPANTAAPTIQIGPRSLTDGELTPALTVRQEMVNNTASTLCRLQLDEVIWSNSGSYLECYDGSTTRFTIGRLGNIAAGSTASQFTVTYDGILSTAGYATVAAATATPAHGSTSAKLLFGTTAGFGIYFGSDTPTVSAAKGSLYLRSDGGGVNDRAYINTDGGTTWTAIVTVG